MNNEYQLPPPDEIPESEMWKPHFEDEQPDKGQQPTRAQQHYEVQQPQGNVTSDELCERLVIGTLLNYQKAWNDNADILTDELFFFVKNKLAYKAAKACINRGDKVDIISVWEEVQKHPKEYQGLNYLDILDLSNNNIVGEELRPKLERLQELKLRRALWTIAKRLETAGVSEYIPVEKVQDEAMSALRDLFHTPSSDIKSMKEVGDEYMKNVIVANREGTRQKFYIPTGFKFFDEQGALQFSDLWIIAGESGQGKSSLAQAIALNAASKGVPTVYYSLEMSNEQLYGRAMSVRIGVPGKIINKDKLTDEQYHRAVKEKDKLDAIPFYFVEGIGSSLDRILSSIRTLYYKKGAKLIIVDYLGLMEINNMNKATTADKYGTMSRRLKSIAQELNICVIALSQLSRDKNDPTPRKARLMNSSQIENDANGIIFIWRPEYTNKELGDKKPQHFPQPFADVSIHGTALIMQAKGRGLGEGSFIAGFNDKLTKFYDLNQDQLPKRADEPKQPDDEGDDVPW